MKHTENRETASISRRILLLLQEEALVCAPLPPETFGRFPLCAQPGMAEALRLSRPEKLLCYEPSLVCEAFLSDPDRLRQTYLELHGLAPDAARALAAQISRRQADSAGDHTRRGRSPGDESESADLARRDSMDYRQFLRRFTIPREEPLLDMASFDYIPYCYGLERYGNLPLIEPLEYREVNRLDELAVAIDTSGSCSGRIVRRFLEETWSILRQRENFFAKMRLHFIQCDSMIQEYRIFTGVEEWEASLGKLRILGQGDTDFRPVFELLNRQIAKKEIRRLRGLLYFTDGDGIFPRTAPPYDTAFVFLNRQTEKHEIPDWAVRLNLNLPGDFLSSVPLMGARPAGE